MSIEDEDQPLVLAETEHSHLEARRQRGIFLLKFACAALGFAIMLQMSMNDNFLVGELHLGPDQKGVQEAVRESCGIFAMGIIALLAGLAEPLLAAAALVVFGLGLGAYSAVPNMFWLVVLSFIWSQGLHVWMPLPNSMMLSLAEPGQTGRRLGQMQASGAIGSGLGLALALGLTLLNVPIRPLYILAGVAALLGAGACLAIPRDIKTPGPRLVFRRRYGMYYLMSFLEGWRKQMAIAFAGFLLVAQYHTSLPVILVLWMASQVLTWLASPMVGRVIDRVGERKVLMFYYASMMLCFCGYALITDRALLWVLFVLDNTFFMLAMALTTYVRRIAPQSEHTSTLSTGVAMNHIAAVSMPLIGGFLWKAYGYKAAFAVGVVAAIASFVAATIGVPRHQAAKAGQ